MGAEEPRKVTRATKQLLEASYREVLDAVKHQDDKIGRLFTGIAFLTAAALAMANLGSAKYLSQKYIGWWAAPPAMLSLAAYLLLVLAAVTILIGSLGTPLRVPGLSGAAPKNPVDWVGPRPASQIYFGEISKLSLLQWREKWTGGVEDLEDELAQSLVGETHNLAARTQFKYGRMNESIALFNLALLFLAITMIMCVGAAAAGTPAAAASMPSSVEWSLAAAVAVFFFLQLLGQVRYTRQTIDDLVGWPNQLGAILRYAWVLSASIWILLLGSGRFVDGCGAAIHWIVAGCGIVALSAGTVLQRRERGIGRGEQKMQWLGPLLAFSAGLVFTTTSNFIEGHTHNFPVSFALALSTAGLLTILAAISPTLNVVRNVRRFKEGRMAGAAGQASTTNEAEA